MAVDGNLTTLSITDADLLARVPTLTRLRDARQPDWSAQIAAGRSDALVAFRQRNVHDPERVVPLQSDAWKRILVFYTLAVIFQPLLGTEYAGEFDKWSEMAEESLARFQFQVDSDGSGTIDDTEMEPNRAYGFNIRR